LHPNLDAASPVASRAPAQVEKAHVRPLTPDDMDQVVALHRQAFGGRGPRAELRTFLHDIFFGHPWLDDTLPSWAYVGETGELAGCLGSMPRSMLLDGQPIRAVVSHNFIVAPGQRSGLAAIQLLRALTASGPDLTLADGNTASRRISEALGATTLLCRSNRWFRVLRPAGLGVHLMSERLKGWRIPRAVNRTLSALSAVPDAMVRAVSPVRTASGQGTHEEMDAQALVELLARLTGHLSLRPVYTADSLGWLLDTLGRSRRDQKLRVGAVRASGDVVGWYVFYSRPGGVGRVLQLGAAPHAQRQVLQRLFDDAWHDGNVAVSGQSDPAWTSALKEGSCKTRPGRTWVLLRTSNRRVEHALATSNAFLSRLEGEGWMRFGY